MFPVVPERALLELARTEGGPDTLTLLVRDQDTRRLLLLRAVLDAAEAAGPSVCTAAQKARLREDWALLTEADRLPAPGAPTSEHRPGRAATRNDRDAPPGARGTSAVADAPPGGR
ncbi:HEXXH motif domain-containing protein, partial [Streptomyces sp. NPDC057144]